MTVHDHPERVKAAARGELAARTVPLACELACIVRDEDRDSVGRFLLALTPEEVPAEVAALLVVLAAMVPVDAAPADLLSFVTWDEYGRPLPGPVRAAPDPAHRPGPKEVQPCGTYAAYNRHKKRGELVDDDCREAARTRWRTRKAAVRLAPVAEVAASGKRGGRNAA